MLRHSYPPQFVLANKPIPVEEAQKALAAYLKDSESQPRLHPDATLGTSKVQFATASGPQGGIILHNLRRVDAGLRGEFLTPEVPEDLSMMDIDAAADTTAGAQQQGQSRDEWEMEQEDVNDMETTANFVANGTEVPEVAVEDSSKVDKEARKKAKKERERQLKREKEQKKRQEADA